MVLLQSVAVGRRSQHAPRHRRESGATRGAGPRSAALDVARGIAIVSVVLLHSADWLSNGRFPVHAWIDLNGIMIGLRMPVFFVVSGLLSSRWRAAGLRSLVCHKVVVLLWFYFLWQLVGTAVGPIQSDIKGEQPQVLHMLASLVLTPVRPRLELWYLWSLAVALVLAQRTARVPVRVQLAAGGVVAAYSLSSLAPTDNPAWLGLPSFYVFFLLGYHYPDAPLALVERTRRSPGLAWLIVAAAAAGCLAAFVLGVGHWMGPGLLIHALGALAALAAAGPLAGSRLLQYLGARTMPIYLAHTPLITVIVWALQPYREHDVVAALAPVLPVLLCAVTVPLTLALHAVLQRTPARVFYAPPAWLVPLAARLTGEPRRGEVSGLATAGLTSS